MVLIGNKCDSIADILIHQHEPLHAAIRGPLTDELTEALRIQHHPDLHIEGLKIPK